MHGITANLWRGFSLAAVLVAGSCAAPAGGKMTFDDPIANHPLLVQPSSQSLTVSVSPAGIAPADMARLDAFVGDYQAHGNGKIVISVPQGAPAATAEVARIAEHVNAMGVSRDQILVANRDMGPGDAGVELNYVSYQASTTPCGDWSENLSYTIDNKTSANLGCAVQHNVAAMVSDPRDLLGPSPMGGADADRRATVITNYEKGTPTAATKTPDQSSAISDVGR
ncbi:MAG TPA: CpaD family pilus assembly protein [Rhizomicrobium sp.]|nr:CpaD family pilus assembly protein [Rhizomicrobium sp.]